MLTLSNAAQVAVELEDGNDSDYFTDHLTSTTQSFSWREENHFVLRVEYSYIFSSWRGVYLSYNNKWACCADLNVPIRDQRSTQDRPVKEEERELRRDVTITKSRGDGRYCAAK